MRVEEGGGGDDGVRERRLVFVVPSDGGMQGEKVSVPSRCS